MPESTQHKLDRVRPPRVQITYDVETLGSIVKTELPFVVGIMADLSGNGLNNPVRTADSLKPLKDRKYVEIDRDNFNTIMEKIEPKVKLTSGGATSEVTFTRLEDFNPINVLRKVDNLNAKFESRTRLSNLVAKLDGNLKLQKDFLAALTEENKTALDAYIAVMDNKADDSAPKPDASEGGTQKADGSATAPDAPAGGTQAEEAQAKNRANKNPKPEGGQ